MKREIQTCSKPVNFEFKLILNNTFLFINNFKKICIFGVKLPDFDLNLYKTKKKKIRKRFTIKSVLLYFFFLYYNPYIVLLHNVCAYNPITEFIKCICIYL